MLEVYGDFMVEVLEGVHSIDFSEAQDHSRELWVLDCPEGVVLVDTGMGETTLEKIKAELALIGKTWRDVEVVLITHRHGDHTRNLKRVRELTNARVMAHKDEVSAIKNQTSVEVQGLDHGERLERYCLDVEQATKEIERLLSYDFNVLLYTHGKDVTEEAKKKIRDLVERTR